MAENKTQPPQTSAPWINRTKRVNKNEQNEQKDSSKPRLNPPSPFFAR